VTKNTRALKTAVSKAREQKKKRRKKTRLRFLLSGSFCLV
jgi:hypothetical protein